MDRAQKQPPEVFYKKAVLKKALLKNFAIYSENTCVGVSGRPSGLQIY